MDDNLIDEIIERLDADQTIDPDDVITELDNTTVNRKAPFFHG